MRLAAAAMRSHITFTAALALTVAISGLAHSGDRVPLVGEGGEPRNGVVRVVSGVSQIISVDPQLIVCPLTVMFNDLEGGDTPGTNYDGVVLSGGMSFAERFAGQAIGSLGDFDAVSGTPSNPLLPQVGAPGQNLDIFDYAGNVLAGLGPIGFPDIDAIGEGSISMLFPVAQSQVRMDLIGGNGGSATLSFYRANGTLIDQVVVNGLADLSYGFATADATPSIAGILIENTDASGMGVVNICYDPGVVHASAPTWGRLKCLYR